MIRKLTVFSLLTLASLSLHAGVKVTSLDLRTQGPNGYISVNIEGRSQELPEIKVSGKIIEITLSDADKFKSISKTVDGASLSAGAVNGKAVIKAALPYELQSSGVSLGWKNKNIEVIFPRGKTARIESDRPVSPKAAPKKNENKVLAKVEGSVAKEALNENYLNKLMNEEKGRTARKETDLVPPADMKADEVKVKQAAAGRIETAETAPVKSDNFSFAGYAVKFAVFLAMVLGLFYGIVQLLKKGVFSRGKLGFLNNTQMIQVLSTTYVGPKRSLMVVKAHNQIFLVANSENGLQFLSEMSDTTGLIKEGEKFVTGTNFDLNLGTAEASPLEPAFKLKENISESTPVPEEKGIAALSAREIGKFSDELKKKARKLKPIEFN